MGLNFLMTFFFQSNYLSEFWGGLGRETDGASESEGHSPSTLTPTIATAPVTLTQPSLPDSTTHQTDASSPKEPLENSAGTVTIKDPRKDSGIRSRRSSIQTQVRCNSLLPRELDIKVIYFLSITGKRHMTIDLKRFWDTMRIYNVGGHAN